MPPTLKTVQPSMDTNISVSECYR